MVSHLHTGKPPPQPYVDYLLNRNVAHCRPSVMEERGWVGRNMADVALCQLYKCTPDELDEEDGERVYEDLICMAAEQRVTEQKRKRG